MTVDSLLAALASLDVVLSVAGERLLFDAPAGALTPELRASIAANRSELIRRLSAAVAHPVALPPQHCPAHSDPRQWVDGAPTDGRIRTTCGTCGRFIGYRPAEPRMTGGLRENEETVTLCRPSRAAQTLEKELMASLYKKPVTVTDPKTGKRVKGKSKKWWGRYRAADGREKRVPLAADKTAAQAMLNDLLRKADREKAGIEDPFDKHRKRPLREQISDFRDHLVNKGATADYVNTTMQRIQAIVDACKFDRICQISASRVQQALADLRRGGKSIASSNHYLQAIKMFTRWLVRDHRTNDDRLAHLSKLNPDLDRKRVRRPLSVEEFGLLLEAAEAGHEIQCVSGPDRVMLYIVGAYTGYRRNEIASVTRTSFDFATAPATLTVKAGYSKHRRTDVLPLRTDFAERLRAWIAAKPGLAAGEPLFRVADKRTAEMIKKDLAAARAKWLKDAEDDSAEYQRRVESEFLIYKNEQGHVVDFHSLRSTFITNLTRSGVTPKTAQMLARHSDINLTMNTYTMLGVVDQVAAVEALPPIPTNSPANERERLRATGTDGRHGADDASKKVPTLVPRGAENGAKRLAPDTLRIAPDCTEVRENGASARAGKNAKKPVESGGFRASQPWAAPSCTEVPEVGLEPTRPCGHWILSPARLPFRHSGMKTAAVLDLPWI